MRIYTLEQFINKANLIHNNKYEYNNVVYTSDNLNVIIGCPIHGDFVQNRRFHLQGRGCRKCGYETLSTNYKDTIEKFIEKSQKKHGAKYDYSKVEYKNQNSLIKIGCPMHGIFVQRAGEHYKYGCEKCGDIRRGQNNLSNIEAFCKIANEKHNFRYFYEKSNYTGTYTKIIIECPIHGEFQQTPNSHLNGQGCPKCKASKGELAILKYLTEHNKNYDLQIKFENCRNIKPLRFDFGIYRLQDSKTLLGLIEYQGEQHYTAVSFGSRHKKSQDIFARVKRNDQIKKDYCMRNSICLLEIPYWEYKNISAILDAFFQIIS